MFVRRPKRDVMSGVRFCDGYEATTADQRARRRLEQIQANAYLPPRH